MVAATGKPSKENEMGNWNPWKMTAIGMALVMITALVTGLVVANWTGTEQETKAPAPVQKASATPTPSAKPAPVRTAQSSAPSQSAIDECNRQAGTQASGRDKTMEVVKDAAIGAVVGAAVGAAGGAIADGGKGAGKGAAIGGVVGAGGGTLYGLNENKKQDESYRAAYSSCMRGRGYSI
jgi:hypothetical protein